MKYLLTPPVGEMARPDRRLRLAQAMCRACGCQWLAGRSLWHPWCGVRLRHAFDLYFERLYEGP